LKPTLALLDTLFAVKAAVAAVVAWLILGVSNNGRSFTRWDNY
jgi:hypothetical protein